ncbi:tricarboxylate carrier [Nitzschia inconspicua]|uniref:Tricarboxylate carrier n=1 Tax=Nitzschia inconspicua TaxID=303405 RepID=A0A9K3KM84_9STRA|nr:tricarboxylate carrier [Nitzschia inconspicua]
MIATVTSAASRVAHSSAMRSGFVVRTFPRRNASVSSATSTSTSATAATGTEKQTVNAAEDAAVPIGASLMAALAGVSVVSAAAALVENMTADSCLPYSPNGQRYSQDEFMGRFSRMLLACDPRLLLYTEDQVRQAQSVLEKGFDGLDGTLSDQQKHRTLWEARRISDAALHPDTKEVIPRPFRMSGYVPYNGPICVAMVASTSTPSLLFWSWVNQSQNALVNYYNRNASSPMSNQTLLTSYSAAVGSALTVAFGLATFIQRRYPAAQAKALMKYVAFPSAVVASSLNCYIVRSPEIDTGIPLTDASGNNVLEGSTSQEAARRGVNSTTVSRALLQAPVYFLPPVLMGMLPPFQRLVQNNPRTRVPLTTFLLLVSFGVGLPVTTAIFPQIAEIDANDVEPQFQHLVEPTTQQPYKVFYYNKGL